jgi:hypothetical protein
MIDFINDLMFMDLYERGEAMTTFGQRVKEAWKNIYELKSKEENLEE